MDEVERYEEIIEGIKNQVSRLNLISVVEVIERDGPIFVVGVQWHPERMIDGDMLVLFKAFIDALKR